MIDAWFLPRFGISPRFFFNMRFLMAILL
jgi:hypothetical protein